MFWINLELVLNFSWITFELITNSRGIQKIKWKLISQSPLDITKKQCTKSLLLDHVNICEIITYCKRGYMSRYTTKTKTTTERTKWHLPSMTNTTLFLFCHYTTLFKVDKSKWWQDFTQQHLYKLVDSFDRKAFKIGAIIYTKKLSLDVKQSNIKF